MEEKVVGFFDNEREREKRYDRKNRERERERVRRWKILSEGVTTWRNSKEDNREKRREGLWIHKKIRKNERKRE